MAVTGVTPHSWAVSLLDGLKAPVTPQNVQAVVGWIHAEGGAGPQFGTPNNTANYNPLNTTQTASGASSVNSVGVKAYGSWQQGLAATLQTLRNGNYGGILGALKAGNNPGAVASAIGSSPWGTNGSLVSSTIANASSAGGGTLIAGGASPSLGSTPGQGSGVGTGSTTVKTSYNTLNQPAFQAAAAKAIAGSYLQNATDPYAIPLPKTDLSPGGVSTGLPTGPEANPLLAAGLLTTTPPDPANYQQAHNVVQKIARAGGSKTPLNIHPSALSGGADIHPLGSGWTLTELDQGVDASARVGAPILAINDSRLVNITPGWYAGQPFAMFQLLSGPNKGKYWYVSEQVDNLPKVGTVIPRGGVVGRFAASGTGIEIGWASGTPGQTLTQKVDPGAVANRHAVGTPQGRAFLHSVLGAQSTLGGS